MLLMLGDQVYADEVSPGTRAFIETRRDPSEPPGERVLDFKDYTQLYLESWGDPTIRWLLSTVSTTMIFDDHDVHDDWNISQAWLDEARTHEWWNEHIKGALASYWVYQHLGNLAPDAHRDDKLLTKVKAGRGRRGDARGVRLPRGPRDRRRALELLPRPRARRGSIVIDSRAGRVLEEGKRSMLDERGVGLGARARKGRLRPPAGGDLAAVAARARDALRARPGARRWRAAPGAAGCRARRGENPPGGRHGALGGLPGVVRPPGRPVQGGRARASGRAARVDRGALRRRAPRLPLRGRLSARDRDATTSGRRCARPTATRSERASGSQIRIGDVATARAWPSVRSPGWRACATPASAGE